MAAALMISAARVLRQPVLARQPVIARTLTMAAARRSDEGPIQHVKSERRQDVRRGIHVRTAPAPLRKGTQEYILERGEGD